MGNLIDAQEFTLTFVFVVKGLGSSSNYREWLETTLEVVEVKFCGIIHNLRDNSKRSATTRALQEFSWLFVTWN